MYIQLNPTCIKKQGIQKPIYIFFMSTRGQYKRTQIYMIGCIGCKNFHIIYQLIITPNNKYTYLQHILRHILRGVIILCTGFSNRFFEPIREKMAIRPISEKFYSLKVQSIPRHFKLIREINH